LQTPAGIMDGRDDVAIADPAVDHQPIADPAEDCVCLAVTDAPLRLTGLGSALINLFIKH
jgi:putative transcriptional regulator